MKTINKIAIMSVVALAMAAVPSVNATGTLLSPRAQGNQIKISNACVGTDRIMDSRASLLSPRARGNQIVKLAGMNDDPNLVTLYNHVTVSPRDLTLRPAPID